MILCLIAFAAVLSVAVWFFSKEEVEAGCVAAFLALCLFSVSLVAADNNVRKGKVEVLNQIGIEYLPKEQVYNKSQAELDKMLKISTASNIYYYEVK